MKKKDSFISKVLILLISVVILAGQAQAQVCDKPLVLGWEPWEPYQYVNRRGDLVGLDVEMVTAIIENMGCKLSYKELPWKRHLNLLKKGSIDLASGASKTAEREEFAYFSAPYRVESAALFVKKGKSEAYKLTKLEDISAIGFKLGVTRGYYYGENYEKLSSDEKFTAQLDEVHNDSFNYYKLQKDRIDGFLADVPSAIAGLKSEALLDTVERHPLKIYEDDIYVMFSKQSTSQEMVEAFNKSLQELKENGTYQQIMDTWLK